VGPSADRRGLRHEAVVQFIGADLSPDFIISDYHLAGSVKGDAAIEEVRREFDRAPPARS